MNVLWKKDATNTQYIDIFHEIQSFEDFCYLPVLNKDWLFDLKQLEASKKGKKQNQLALRLLNEGNDLFNQKKYVEAMFAYNRSLCFAEVGSREISLVYANRATCFLELKMYDKCLIDIDLAIKANYPVDLMGKLETRKGVCIKRMKNGDQYEQSIPTLDFEADQNFPGMANVLEIQCNEKFGRHIVAKRDLDVGQIVLIDEPFVTTRTSFKQTFHQCEVCLKMGTNFVPCENCVNALFCSQPCIDNNGFHSIICDKINVEPDASNLRCITQSIFVAINAFPSTDRLVKFVENVVNDTESFKRVPQSSVDMESKYRTFFTSCVWLGDSEKKWLQQAKKAYEYLITLPEIQAAFIEQSEKWFFMHLVVMHTFIILSNEFQQISKFETKENSSKRIYLLMNYFNHSCAPNLMHYSYENKLVCFVLRRVQRGEQLFLSYRNRLKYSQRERNEDLRLQLGVNCECHACRYDIDPVDVLINLHVRESCEVRFIEREIQKGKGSEMERIVQLAINNSAMHLLLRKMCLSILKMYGEVDWYNVHQLKRISGILSLLLNNTIVFSQQ